MRGPVAGLVLAGGQSRRMGGTDKALLDLGGTSLVARAAARLSPQVDAVAISANGDPARFAALGLPVLADPVAGHAGPLAGLLAGLEWAAGRGCTAVASVAVDTPFFPADLVERLARATGERPVPAIAASAGRAHPVFGLWPLALADALRAVLAAGAGLAVGAFARANGAVEVPFAASPGFDPFFNVNTPEELALARRIAAGPAP